MIDPDFLDGRTHFFLSVASMVALNSDYCRIGYGILDGRFQIRFLLRLGSGKTRINLFHTVLCQGCAVERILRDRNHHSRLLQQQKITSYPVNDHPVPIWHNSSRYNNIKVRRICDNRIALFQSSIY